MSRGWLSRYIDGEASKWWTKRVVKIDDFSCVTDGILLLCVKDGGAQEWNSRDNDYVVRAQNNIRAFLKGQIHHRLFTSLQALRGFAGKVVASKCRRCRGGGSVSDDADNITFCEHCQMGLVFKEASKRPARIAEMWVDLNRLAFLLPQELLALPGNERVNVGTYPGNSSENALALETTSWRAFLMSVNVDRLEEVRAGKLGEKYAPGIYPHFHSDPVYQALVADDEAHLVLADWLEEHDDPYAPLLREEALRDYSKRTKRKRKPKGVQP